MLLLVLLACAGPTLIATVPEATRLAEMANGELLVGTSTGRLWLVDTFGDTREVTGAPKGSVAGLVGDPMGKYWARTSDGRVFEGALWSAPRQVATDARLVLRDCSETRWMVGERSDGITAIALGPSCEELIEGTERGVVRGERVTDAPIRRVHSVDGGVLWVDDAGHAGCLACDTHVPEIGVVDAVSLHLPPFVPGEIVWLDGEGHLWATPG